VQRPAAQLDTAERALADAQCGNGELGRALGQMAHLQADATRGNERVFDASQRK
jgi:hypothetical protein